MPDNNLFDIKKRLTAANQTRKITRTMELIASSRLHRCKMQIVHYQGWMTHMRRAADCLPSRYFVPLVKSAEGIQSAYIIFGGSKGLSGYYGPAVFQYAAPIVEGHKVLAVGSSAAAFFPDAHSDLGNEIPSADYAKSIADAALALYESREVSAVYMIYAKGSAHVTEPLLPLARPKERQPVPAITEPSAKALHPSLYREFAASLVHEAHLQAFMAEQIVRVSAMDSATQNADEIIENLQATYNRIRQSSITQEIITVSNAARGDG